MKLLKEIGVSVDKINFDVLKLNRKELEQTGIYYEHSDPEIDYTIYLRGMELKGYMTIPYGEYSEMKHRDIAQYIKEKFIDKL